MKTISENCKELVISDLDLTGLSTAEKLTITVNINKTESFTKTYDLPLDTSEIVISGGVLTLKESFFGKDLVDGIYHIQVNIKTEDVFKVEKGCSFIDCKIKCLVSTHTGKSLDKDSKLLEQEESLMINLLYLALKEGSNCNCNCDELQDIYDKLIKELQLNLNDNECGC